MSISSNDKLNIITNINNIRHKKQFIKIFIILNKDENIKYTKNNNGIFFNLNKVSDEILIEVKEYLDNIKNNTTMSDLSTEN